VAQRREVFVHVGWCVHVGLGSGEWHGGLWRGREGIRLCWGVTA